MWIMLWRLASLTRGDDSFAVIVVASDDRKTSGDEGPSGLRPSGLRPAETTGTDSAKLVRKRRPIAGDARRKIVAGKRRPTAAGPEARGMRAEGIARCGRRRGGRSKVAPRATPRAVTRHFECRGDGGRQPREQSGSLRIAGPIAGAAPWTRTQKNVRGPVPARDGPGIGELAILDHGWQVTLTRTRGEDPTSAQHRAARLAVRAKLNRDHERSLSR